MALFFLASVLIAGTAEARPKVDVEIGGGAAWVLDDGFGLVTETSALGRTDVAAWVHPGWLDGKLALRLGHAYGGVEATSFSTMRTAFTAHTVDASAAWSFLEGARGRAVLRAGPLVDVQGMELGDGDQTLSGSAWAFGLVAAVGGTAWLGDGDGVAGRLGVFFETGWAQRLFTSDLTLAPDVSGTPEPARIEATPVNAGELSLSGPFLQAGLVVRL